MEKYSSFVVIFCAVFLPKALGFPYKDVSIDCFSMLPNCGGGPQTSTPPYVVSVSFDRYDPGNEIQVTLEGTSPAGFTAFMVQAREIDGNVPVGMFRIRDPNTQGYPCANMTNSAVSHTNPSIKRKVTTTWVAPQGTNKIRLMATFLQDYDTYWVGVHSKTLSPRFSEVASISKPTNDSKPINASKPISDPKPINVSMAANSSDLASDNVASVVPDIADDSEEYHDDFDFNALLGDTEAVYDNEIPVDSEETPDSRTENATERSRRKSVVTVNVNCGEAGAVQSSSGGCVKSTQGSSQNSGSQAKVIVVKEGSSSGSGCGGGGTASVYNKFGCRDNAAASGSQSSYGQSVSTSKVKVVTYPESKPFPPEKIANAGGIIYSQGSRPQGGSSETVRITVQEGGKGSPACDKTSSSYNIKICNQNQLSNSQSTSSFGTQGSKPQGGSSETVRVTIQEGRPSGSQGGSSVSIQGGQPSGSQGSQASGSQGGSSASIQGQSSGSQGSSYSGKQQGGSYSTGGSPCGKGVTYDSNPCNQGQASSSSSSSSSYSSSSSSQSTYGQVGVVSFSCFFPVYDEWMMH
ncbi:uncharacterized protein DDB_G0271670-like isoform X2 [Lacerta agilis]|uniref:uncharacterized protein DDB_G0271670-like isoform X2 n=1 Tax=Lacerta agilis TaxID=80427 RepID=UPI00141A5761|nr:uncharacterized protein DDB_G0271670-like isoform X2 [Lacerta agilis]